MGSTVATALLLAVLVETGSDYYCLGFRVSQN